MPVMGSLDDQQLEALVRAGEADRIEYKRNASDMDRLREAICAFANDLPDRRLPGVVFVGLEDDGACAGLPISDALPTGAMQPAGYVIARYASFGSSAAMAFQRWRDRAPAAYARSVLDLPDPPPDQPGEPHRLAQLKDYRSLMALAQEARKPMFLLRPADGAIGGHQAAVRDCYDDFSALAEAIERRIGL